MNVKHMAKVLLIGLGLGVAASAYAATCAQCVREMEVCEYNNQSNCASKFQACMQNTSGRCWMP